VEVHVGQHVRQRVLRAHAALGDVADLIDEVGYGECFIKYFNLSGVTPPQFAHPLHSHPDGFDFRSPFIERSENVKDHWGLRNAFRSILGSNADRKHAALLRRCFSLRFRLCFSLRVRWRFSLLQS
uniref:Choline/ethanolamine kinase n=1 Tax=Macrostomum lignano TaxID=282301 RepID=A0A1I8FWT1_9PLAT